MKIKGKHYAMIIGLIFVALLVYSIATRPQYDSVFTPKPVQGSAEAEVQLVEFGDLQCPACGAAHPIVKQITAEYGDTIGYTFRHFPLRAIHPWAYDAAQAAECANDQGKYYEFIDMAFAGQSDLSKGSLRRMADNLGLDTESFRNCLDSGAKRKVVDEDISDGRQRQVSSTPTFYINDRRVQNWNGQNLRNEINAVIG